MYIAYNKNTNRVIGQPSEKPFITITEGVLIAEIDIVPEKYDYLEVEDVCLKTRILEDGQSEQYTYCTLVAKFRTLTPEQEQAKLNRQYNALCQTYIRQLYSQSDENKILREIRAYPDDEKVIARFNKYNDDIEDCLNRAHIKVYNIERVKK